MPGTTTSPLSTTTPGLVDCRDAVLEAAAFSTNLWLSYLIVLLYWLVAAAGVTQKDLFLEDTVQLPLLGVPMPLQGFFWLSPILFVIIHTYILLHFSLLGEKAGIFNLQLLEQVPNHLDQQQIRRQLPNNIFVYFLAGPDESRTGVFGILLRAVAWISLVIGPVCLLMFFQLQFLPFHAAWITWLQRVTVLLDLALIWKLWPTIVHGGMIGQRGYGRGLTRTLLAVFTAIALGMIFIVATFPGEWLEAYVWNREPFSWVRNQIVHGPVNMASGKRSSLWTDTIVLTNFDAIDHSKFSSDAAFEDVQSTYAIRGRDLQFAQFVNDNFRKVDFTGSDLTYAVFNQSDLREARFGCTSDLNAWTIPQAAPTVSAAQAPPATPISGSAQESAPICTNLPHASFFRARLQGAVFDRANLQDASFAGASLQATSFLGAHLEGANLQGASLQDAFLASADLDSTNLRGAWLQTARLVTTRLNNADLTGAHLQYAILNRVQLQHALLDGAGLQGASLGPADLTGATIGSAQFSSGSFTGINPKEMLIDLQRAFPGNPPTRQEHEAQEMQYWQMIGCQGDGGPFVIRDMIAQINIAQNVAPGTPAQAKLATAFLQPNCQGNNGLTPLEQAELRALSVYQAQ